MSPDRRRHGAGPDRFASGRSPQKPLPAARKGPREQAQATEADRQARVEDKPPAQPDHAAGMLLLIRVALPAALAIGGIVLASVGLALLGAALLTSALIAVLVGFFARLTIASNFERDAEEQARRTFRETGRWPRR